MENNFWNLIGLIILVAAAYITNPKQDDFKHYISNELVNERENGTAQIAYRGLKQELAKSIMDLFITVRSKDYFVCSVHTIDDLSGIRRKYLGLFTFFIKLPD